MTRSPESIRADLAEVDDWAEQTAAMRLAGADPDRIAVARQEIHERRHELMRELRDAAPSTPERQTDAPAQERP